MTDEVRTSRRIVFQGLGALGVAAVLAGCGGDDGNGSTSNGTTAPTETSTEGGSGGNGGGPAALATTDEIPVGGGIVLPDEDLVITQPTAGEFLGFSSICAHQGFDVGTVSDGTITCNVHGSQYDAATGEQTGGPAPEGSSLAPKEIRVKGNQIFLA